MTDGASIATAAALGFFSSTHCIGMCGGIMGALSMAVDSSRRWRRWTIVLTYNLGRIASYSAMGALVGLLGHQLTAMGAGSALRVLAAGLLLAMALYLSDIWRGLVRLESLGQLLWRRIQPFAQRLMPVRSSPKALLLGMLWGWLPCGLVYTALGYAMTQPSAAAGATTMLAFGLGTLPAVLLAGALAGRLARLARAMWLRRGAALTLALFAGWTLYGALGSHHDHHGATGSGEPTLEAPGPHHHH